MGLIERMSVSKTVEGLRDDSVVQFSVFMANKVGRLNDIAKLFQEKDILIVALTVIDTADSAIARMVVTDPSTARDILLEHGVAFTECTLAVVELPHGPSDLGQVLSSLLMAECNIHFTYSFLMNPRGTTLLGLHVDDDEVAGNVLRQNGFKLLCQKDISR